MIRTPSQRFEASLTKDNLWIYILSLLRTRQLYAYELNPKIRERFGFSPGDVTAYIVLQRLKGEGFVKATMRRKQSGPVRHYYGITGKGAAELRKARAIYAKYGKFF
jgi:DNA-binding PadR family transcriptional regulator